MKEYSILSVNFFMLSSSKYMNPLTQFRRILSKDTYMRRNLRNTAQRYRKMEEETCFNCGKFFERREKGYKRKFLSSLKIPIIKLNDILEKKNQHYIKLVQYVYLQQLCLTNCQYLQTQLKNTWAACTTNSKTKKKIFFYTNKILQKKTHDINTSLKTATTGIHTSIQTKKEGFKDKVIEYIQESRYPAAFKLLLKKSRCARD